MSTPSDKFALTGNDLFEYLTKELNAQARKKAGKPASPDRPINTLANRQLSDTGWFDCALVLIIMIHTCDSCGATYRVSNPYPLIKQRHLRHGTHYSPITNLSDPMSRLNSIPREIEERPCSIPVCEACFNSSPLGLVLCKPKLAPAEEFTIDNPPSDKHRLLHRK